MRTLSLFLLALVVACSSTGQGAESQPNLPAISDGNGRVYFFRSSGMGGAAIRPEITLNGQTVGRSSPGTWFYVDREPGTYEVRCSVIMEHSTMFPLEAGETVYVKTRVTMGVYAGHARPSIVSAGEAQSAIAKCKYTGS